MAKINYEKLIKNSALESVYFIISVLIVNMLLGFVKLGFLEQISAPLTIGFFGSLVIAVIVKNILSDMINVKL